jgi:hypothetical protein
VPDTLINDAVAGGVRPAPSEELVVDAVRVPKFRVKPETDA